jgi:fructokinase
MSTPILVLGEALMDCIAQPDGSLLPLKGGSPYNMARAAALQDAQVGWLTPFSIDTFGQQLKAQAEADGVQTLSSDSTCPTSLAVVTVRNGQPQYGFYREGIADRDYTPESVLSQLARLPVGVLHTGSLMLIPPEEQKVLRVLEGAQAMGWTISLDVNLRPGMARDLDEYRSGVLAAVALADWVKASDEDLETLGFADASLDHADAVRQRFARGRNRRVALTFGGAGAYLWVDGHSAQAAAPVVTVTDTVGAGDTFWGTCLARWTLKQENAAAHVADILEMAMRAAAINCTRKGCQPPRTSEL